MISRFVRRVGIFLAALLSSLLLVFSVTLANLFLSGKFTQEKKYVKTEVAVQKIEEKEKQKEVRKQTRKPNRQKSSARTPKAGPRLAMNLGVANAGGASVREELVSDFLGRQMSSGNGEVDKKPESKTLPNFQVPPKIRDSETDATLRLSFCVDESGRVYNIQVLEESPMGFGLAEAGRASLERLIFSPAQKDGRGVSFCGMEQPFEIRFRD